MPLVNISILIGKPQNEKKVISDVILTAIMEALNIPKDTFHILINEYNNDNFVILSGNKESSIIVEISIFKGRSIDLKRILYKKIVDGLAPLGFKPLEVFIIVNENDMENFGIRGGYPAIDLYKGH